MLDTAADIGLVRLGWLASGSEHKTEEDVPLDPKLLERVIDKKDMSSHENRNIIAERVQSQINSNRMPGCTKCFRDNPSVHPAPVSCIRLHFELCHSSSVESCFVCPFCNISLVSGHSILRHVLFSHRTIVKESFSTVSDNDLTLTVFCKFAYAINGSQRGYDVFSNWRAVAQKDEKFLDPPALNLDGDGLPPEIAGITRGHRNGCWRRCELCRRGQSPHFMSSLWLQLHIAIYHPSITDSVESDLFTATTVSPVKFCPECSAEFESCISLRLHFVTFHQTMKSYLAVSGLSNDQLCNVSRTLENKKSLVGNFIGTDFELPMLANEAELVRPSRSEFALFHVADRLHQ